MATYDDDRAQARDSLTMRMDGLRSVIIAAILAAVILLIGAVWMFGGGDANRATSDNAKVTTERSTAPNSTQGIRTPTTPKQP